jgi:hypothetical protein
MKLRLLSKSDVQQAITMREAIEVVKDAFTQLSAGQTTVPLRTVLEVPEREAVTLFMPAYLAASGEMGAKVVSRSAVRPPTSWLGSTRIPRPSSALGHRGERNWRQSAPCGTLSAPGYMT